MRNIFRKGRSTNFKLVTHEDPHHLQAPWPSRSKVKVAWWRDASERCWPIRRERNAIETPKLVGRLPTPRAIKSTSFKVKGQRSRSPGRLMWRQEVHHIFWMKRPTNFKLGTQMEYKGSYHRQAPWPPRSKVNVAKSRDASDRCWPISRKRNVNVLEIPKLLVSRSKSQG